MCRKSVGQIEWARISRISVISVISVRSGCTGRPCIYLARSPKSVATSYGFQHDKSLSLVSLEMEARHAHVTAPAAPVDTPITDVPLTQEHDGDSAPSATQLEPSVLSVCA